MSVDIELRNGVQWITINRPERRNAINEDVIEGIANGIRSASASPDARAIVLTGAGDKAFCAGADLQIKQGAGGSPFAFDASEPRHFIGDLFRLVESCDLPLIARVNGAVRAGGMGLLCMCDMAVTTDSATFGTPETQVGLFPMMILPYMSRTIPLRKLLEMCITGEAFSAEEAMTMGLVNYVVPPSELDAKMEWLLGRIVDKSPVAIRIGKYAFHALRDMTLPQAWAYTEANIRVMSMSDDAREGIQAFAEKRKPQWGQKKTE